MSTSEINYRASEAAAQQRLHDWQALPEPGTLERELGLLRHLIDEAVRSKNTAMANALLTTLNRLVRTHEESGVACGELISRDVVLRVALQVAGIVAEEFRGVPDWEARVDRAVAKITGQVSPQVAPRITP